MSNNKIPLAIAIATTLTTGSALAAEEAKAAHTCTANVGVYSQYIFRGLTQTNEEPALQGGLDYSHASGFYAGVWGSNISWLRENFTVATPGGKAVSGLYDEGGSLELDLYGGFRGTFGKSDFTYDVGTLYYWYPGDVFSGCRFVAPGTALGTASCPDADTWEVYGALGWKWLSVKYSYSLDDTFGAPDSDGTWYLEANANIPLGDSGFTLGLHYGKQEYDGSVPGTSVDYDDFLSYEDYKIALTYDLGKLGNKLGGTTLGVAYTDTSGADVCGYGKFSQTGSVAGNTCTGVFPNNIADSQVVVWVQRTF
jgi:uncharacterized protein (TIGR02001 family)